MSSVEKAYETQIKNIQAKTGKSLEELGALMQSSGLTKHGELRAMFKQTLALGHGDANALVHVLLSSDGERAAKASGASIDQVLDGIYTGGKAELRPLHERLMAAIEPLGAFEVAPKKGYVSLRRKRQFAMIGPASKGRLAVGLNMKGLEPGERLIAMPAGGMCTYKVYLSDAAELDAELLDWLRQAFDSAG
jgi:hypothetical protein